MKKVVKFGVFTEMDISAIKNQVLQVSAGAYFSLLLDKSGTLWGCGK